MKLAAVVRTFNSDATLSDCLRSIRRQGQPIELIVVDSGSSDHTLELARRFDASIIAIRHADYTPGYALNCGIDAARNADVCLILSSHCVLPFDRFADEVQRLHRELDVEATNGALRDPSGQLLTQPLVDQTWPHRENVLWGFSNHSGSVRRATWVRQPFDQHLDACEDKEWAKRIHHEGGRIAYSPSLAVTARHRRTAGLLPLYRRAFREGLRCAELAGPASIDIRSTAWRQLTAINPASRLPLAAHMLRPSRLTETTGAVRGIRAGVR